MLEAVRLVARFQDMAVVGEPVEQRGGHLFPQAHLLRHVALGTPFTTRCIGGRHLRHVVLIRIGRTKTLNVRFRRKADFRKSGEETAHTQLFPFTLQRQPQSIQE